MSDMLTHWTIRAAREQMLKSPTIYFIMNPNQLMIHPSWFLHKDGTRMNMERKSKRLAAIRRLIDIKMRRFRNECT